MGDSQFYGPFSVHMIDSDRTAYTLGLTVPTMAEAQDIAAPGHLGEKALIIDWSTGTAIRVRGFQ